MNEHVAETVALYALGGLEPAEAAGVARHLADCAACRALAEEAHAAVNLLPEAVSPATPSPRVRRQLMARVRAARRGPERRAWAWPNLGQAVAFAALALSIAMGAWNLYLQRQAQTLAAEYTGLVAASERQAEIVALITAPGMQSAELGATEAGSPFVGRAFLSPQTGQALFVAYALEPLPENQVYQCWLIGPDGPVSVGIWQGKGQPTMQFIAPLPPGDYSAAGVSLEPAGGSLQPTRVVLVGGF